MSETPRLKSASFSRWENFVDCPYKAWLAYGEKIPEPTDPDAPETPGERGNRIHEQAEAFVRGKGPLPNEAKDFKLPLTHLKNICKGNPESIVMEQMWNFDDDWLPLPGDLKPGDPLWEKIWLRAKLDVFVRLSPEVAVVVDYKSGKRWGKEIQHESQAQVYAVSAFRRFPELRVVWAEFWYFGKDLLHRTQYRWPGANRHLQSWKKRLGSVTSATRFPKTPSRRACFYCPYRTGTIGKYGLDGTSDCSANLGVD